MPVEPVRFEQMAAHFKAFSMAALPVPSTLGRRSDQVQPALEAELAQAAPSARSPSLLGSPAFSADHLLSSLQRSGAGLFHPFPFAGYASPVDLGTLENRIYLRSAMAQTKQ